MVVVLFMQYAMHLNEVCVSAMIVLAFVLFAVDHKMK
jgi:hypothetical protein